MILNEGQKIWQTVFNFKIYLVNQARIMEAVRLSNIENSFTELSEIY